VAAQKQGGSVEEFHYVPAEIREVSFPVSLRGYSRRVVDAYVQHVSRVIEELEVSRSPRSAVRRALDRVGEQVGGILQRAQNAAEEITTTARQEAEEITALAKAEAAELVVNAGAQADRQRAKAEQIVADAQAAAEKTVAQANAEAAERVRRAEEESAALRQQAEARIHEIRADTDAVWHERLRLLDGMRETASRLETVASHAAVQFPRPEPAQPAQQRSPQPAPVAADEPSEASAKREPHTNTGVTGLPTRNRNRAAGHAS
jgi:DivIVA domain-containing protein